MPDRDLCILDCRIGNPNAVLAFVSFKLLILTPLMVSSLDLVIQMTITSESQPMNIDKSPASIVSPMVAG